MLFGWVGLLALLRFGRKPPVRGPTARRTLPEADGIRYMVWVGACRLGDRSERENISGTCIEQDQAHEVHQLLARLRLGRRAPAAFGTRFFYVFVDFGVAPP